MSDYTKKFWDLSETERLKELDQRIQSGDKLSVLFEEQNQLILCNLLPKVYNSDGPFSNHLELMEEIKKQEPHRDAIIQSNIIPTRHDSHAIAHILAERVYTEYCYTNGVNPDTIKATYIDGRFRAENIIPGLGNMRIGKFSFPGIGAKKQKVIAQQSIVFIDKKK